MAAGISPTLWNTGLAEMIDASLAETWPARAV
jgi:hypothetical protein